MTDATSNRARERHEYCVKVDAVPAPVVHIWPPGETPLSLCGRMGREPEGAEWDLPLCHLCRDADG